MCDETMAAASALHKQREGSCRTEWVKVDGTSILIRELCIDRCTLGKSHIFFLSWPVNQQLESDISEAECLRLKQSTRRLNLTLKGELFEDLMHLSVSPAHFTLCISVASARRPASHITIFPSASMDRPLAPHQLLWENGVFRCRCALLWAGRRCRSH